MVIYDNPLGVEQKIVESMDIVGRLIPITAIWDTKYEDYQIWYDIPDYNGYQLSDYGNIRSMKFKNKYPFGILVRYLPHKNKFMRKYLLNRNDNRQIELTLLEIVQLVDSKFESLKGHKFIQFYESYRLLMNGLSKEDMKLLEHFIAGDKPVTELPKQLIKPIRFIELPTTVSED